MRTLLIILALVAYVDASVSLPRWWPASKGEVAKAKEELSEVDIKVSESIRSLFETDQNLIALLELSQELGPHVGSLKVISQMSEREIKDLMELTRQRHDTYVAEGARLDQGFNLGGLDLGTLARGLAGDPTALIGGLSTLLLGGATLHQSKKKKEAQGQKDEMKKKAIKWASMDPKESKKELVADKEIPEIT
jgi:hypothetical protein